MDVSDGNLGWGVDSLRHDNSSLSQEWEGHTILQISEYQNRFLIHVHRCLYLRSFHASKLQALPFLLLWSGLSWYWHKLRWTGVSPFNISGTLKAKNESTHGAGVASHFPHRRSPVQTPAFNQRQPLYLTHQLPLKQMETTRVSLLKVQPCPLKGAHSYIWHTQK